jgi:drug/metabolite transporter (DMT)-like permease
MAVIALTPVIIFLDKKNKDKKNQMTESEKAYEKKYLIYGGIATGVALFVASSLQQYAMAFTTAAKAGFITTLYVILVPIVGIFLKKRVRPVIWLCAIMGVIGLYLLSMQPGTFSISHGDFFVLLCALGYTAHILIIDYFSPKTDGVKLSCLQFVIVSVCSFIAMTLTETLVLSDVLTAIVPLLYAGVLSSAVAYTLQIVAQKDADPTIASLILSLESVFAAICGAIILGEALSMREAAGCAIMFIAIIIAQLPSKEERLADRH